MLAAGRTSTPRPIAPHRQSLPRPQSRHRRPGLRPVLNRYKEIVHDEVEHRPPLDIIADIEKLDTEITHRASLSRKRCCVDTEVTLWRCRLRGRRHAKRSIPEYFGDGTPWLSIADLNDGIVNECQKSRSSPPDCQQRSCQDSSTRNYYSSSPCTAQSATRHHCNR